MEKESVRVFTSPINKDGDKFYIHRNGITIAVRCHDVSVEGNGIVKGKFEIAYPTRHIVEGYLGKDIENRITFHDYEQSRDAYKFSFVYLSKLELDTNIPLKAKYVEFINPYPNITIDRQYSVFYANFFMQDNNGQIRHYSSRERFDGKVSGNNELFLVNCETGKMVMKFPDDRFSTEKDCEEYVCRKRRESQVYDFDEESVKEEKIHNVQIVVDGKVVIETIFSKSISI